MIPKPPHSPVMKNKLNKDLFFGAYLILKCSFIIKCDTRCPIMWQHIKDYTWSKAGNM